MDETTIVFSDMPKDSYAEFFQPYFDEPIDGKTKVNCINHTAHKRGDKNKSAFVDPETGIYFCSVCGTYTPYKFLVDIIGMEPPLASATVSSYKAKLVQKTEKFHVDLWRKGLNTPLFGYKEMIAEAEAELRSDYLIVSDYLQSRSLQLSTLQDWNVGYVPQVNGQPECLVFPYFLNEEVVAVKGRTLDGRKGSVRGATLVPFGVHRLRNASIAIICEGETDTLVMYQALKNAGRLNGDIAVVGIPGAASFPKEWQRFFSHLLHVYVVPQADSAADVMVSNIIDRIGSDRVSVLQLNWSFSDVGKDIADWVAQHSETELSTLVPDVDFRPKIMTTDEIMEQADQEIDWLIPNLLATQEKAMIIGAPKSMKTFLALHLTECLAKGKPFLGNSDWHPDPHRVLFVEEEGNVTQFARRIRRMFKDGDDGNVKWMHKTGLRLDTEVQQTAFEREVESFKPELIIFDPFKSLHGQDENDNTAMGVLWGIINAFIVRHPNTAVLFIHHVPKSEKNKKLDLYSARGAGISAAELDVGFGLRHSDSEEGTLYMSLEGREVPVNKGEIVIRVDADFNFKMDGYKTDVSPTKQKDKNKADIHSFLLVNGGSHTIRELAEELDLTDARVRSAVKALVSAGTIKEELGEGDGGRRPKVYYV